MRVSVQSRSGRELVSGGVSLADGATVTDLKKALHKNLAKYYPDRQRLTLPPAPGQKRGTALADGKSLSDYGIDDGSVVQFKDLGPQIGWTTVFFWEYFGPLCVYPLFYFLPHMFYPWASSVPEKATVQKLALAYNSFHYTKRILETFFVHQFSHGTMPISNLVKNCTYYWGFTAWISYFINHPLYTAPPEMQSYVAFGFAALCQLSNFKCHLILANLRPPGSKEYRIPSGFLFNYITCANYTTEICGWLAFAAGTQSLTALLFGLAGAIQMADWALAKHRRLKKIFDGNDGRPKYPRRWVMLPPLF